MSDLGSLPPRGENARSFDELVRELDPQSRARLHQLIGALVDNALRIRETGRPGKVTLELHVTRRGTIERSSHVKPPFQYPIDG